MASAGVIFDLDGVIVDSEPLQHRAYNAVLERFGVRVGREEYAREWIAAGRGPEYAVRRYALPLSPLELRRLKDPIYHALLRAEATMVAGAGDVVRRLAARFPLALATNSNAEDTGFVLDRFALRAYFNAVVTREQYDAPKPAPDAFRAAAAQLGCAPAACVVIEDAHKGIVAAAAAGCPCVAFPHGYTAATDCRGAQRVITTLDEVTVDLVESLTGRAGGAEPKCR